MHANAVRYLARGFSVVLHTCTWRAGFFIICDSSIILAHCVGAGVIPAVLSAMHFVQDNKP